MKKSKRLTVTVGIPAYNEEKNISNAINSVLLQDQHNFLLKKIIVISDGSNDSTCKIVKSIKNSQIKLIVGKKRAGKFFRLNQFFKIANTELLILLDADCVIHKNAIESFVKIYLQSERKVQLLCAKSIPVKAKNFTQQVLSASINVYDKVIMQKRRGNNVYSFRGSLMCLGHTFYKKVSVPNTVGTDAFLYFSAINMGLKTGCSHRSIAYYNLPAGIRGHIRQSSRFLSSKDSMAKFFGSNVFKEYKLKLVDLIKATLSEVRLNPLPTLTYVAVYFYVKLIRLFHENKTNGIWEVSQSTKNKINVFKGLNKV